MILCKLFTYFFIFLNDWSFVAVYNILYIECIKKNDTQIWMSFLRFVM